MPSANQNSNVLLSRGRMRPSTFNPDTTVGDVSAGGFTFRIELMVDTDATCFHCLLWDDRTFEGYTQPRLLTYLQPTSYRRFGCSFHPKIAMTVQYFVSSRGLRSSYSLCHPPLSSSHSNSSSCQQYQKSSPPNSLLRIWRSSATS